MPCRLACSYKQGAISDSSRTTARGMQSHNGRAVPYGKPIPCKCIIKLGGSAITVKHQHETLKADVLSSVANSLKSLFDELQGQEDRAGFVVVHGAGSFGHFEASQYGITKPDTPQHTLLEGFARTRRSVTRLNHLVVSALIDAGIPAVGLSPFGSCFSIQGQLQLTEQHSPGWQQGYVDAVQATLCSGLVPVLHGDGILEAAGPQGRYRDGHITPTILSGDKIMLCLAKHLQIQYALFLTDVPGVLTQPPSQPGAQLIPRVWVQPDTGALQFELPAEQQQEQQQQQGGAAGVQMTTAAHDTTGGIAAKVQAAADIARAAAAPVIIAQAGTAAGEAAVLHGAAATCGNSSSSNVSAAGDGTSCNGAAGEHSKQLQVAQVGTVVALVAAASSP